MRRWERQGKLMPVNRTHGGQRRYDLAQFHSSKNDTVSELPTIAYARVSSHDQKEDLQRQEQMLEFFLRFARMDFRNYLRFGFWLELQQKRSSEAIKKDCQWGLKPPCFNSQGSLAEIWSRACFCHM